MYQGDHEDISDRRCPHRNRCIGEQNDIAINGIYTSSPYYSNTPDSDEYSYAHETQGVYKGDSERRGEESTNDNDWSIPNARVDSRRLKGSLLDDLVQLACQEAEQMDRNREKAEENIFNPPNSPKRNTFDYLKEIAYGEANKLDAMYQATRTRESPRKINYIAQAEQYANQRDIAQTYGSALAMPLQSPCNSSQETQGYTRTCPVKSFNDFDESIFVFNDKTGMYACPAEFCTKEFPSLSRIKRHFIIHTNIKPFRCRNKECGRTFSRKDNMLQHYRVHCPYSQGNN